MVKFPGGFLWGAATAAYQVEGDNRNSDWWRWELQTGKEHSGPACRHYELYERDFDLAQSLHHNAHRLSIEWARVEPEPGKFSVEAMAHYVAVIKALRDRGIEPVVTLHHFTNPAWFSKLKGWENRRSVAYFLRYCEYVVRALAPLVSCWITINEPTVYICYAYVFGEWPPQERSYLKAKIVEDNFVTSHVRANRLIKRMYREARLARPCVGIAQNMMAFVPCTNRLRDRFAAYVRDTWYNFGFLDQLNRHRSMDFIGVNYYSRQLVELTRWGLPNIAMDTCRCGHHPVKKNSLGWDIYPEGLFELLVKLKRFKLPVMITENGICTQDDNLRWEYIRLHLLQIHRAMQEGARVTGYLYWSLLDNFEWDKGFAPRFGLIGVDYSTFARTVRESAVRYGQVCATGELD